MKVIIAPGKDQQWAGVTSFASWKSQDLKDLLEVLCNVRRDVERLVQIEIDQHGITARLEYIK